MAKIYIKNALVWGKQKDVLIQDGVIAQIGTVSPSRIKGATQIDATGKTLLPAFVDMHVHLREPGFEYKEDIASGTAAAVAGGFATVCCMPNTNPVTDNPYIVRYIIDRAKEANLARVYPIGAITKGLAGECLAEMGKMQQAGAIAVSDDGQPVTTAQTMRLALEYCKPFNMLVISHCEDKSLVADGVMNEGLVASELGLKGIPSAAEDVMIAREILLAEMLHTRVHIAHVSTASGVELIRHAKARGVQVTCETCPHYFAATDELMRGYNACAKVNPPIRTEADRRAIIRGLQDGTIDVIATDHAPHAMHEKNLPVPQAANGISGLETAFALAYTALVETGELTLRQLSDKMTGAAHLLGLPCGELRKGAVADLTLVDTQESYTVDAAKFRSKGKNTPFQGRQVRGRVLYTIVDGEIKYDYTKENAQ